MGIHECGLVLRTVESPTITAGQAVVGNRRRLSGWGPASEHGGLVSRSQPWLFLLLLPLSVLLVTLVGPYPVFAFLFRLPLHVLSVWAFLSAPALPRPSAPAMPSASLSCPTPTPCHFSCICFSVPSASLSSSLCSLCSIRQLFHVAKEKKKWGEGIETQKKAQTKTNLECVTKCCVLLVASVCPCGLQPARPPHPSAVCPARLPALPLLPTTRSSVPGCLVMVPDV